MKTSHVIMAFVMIIILVNVFKEATELPMRGVVNL